MITLEETRLSRQADLDAEKSAAQRNELGQFATPSLLAEQVIRAALRHLGPEDRKDIRFLDPGVGSGAFFSALLRSTDREEVTAALGVDLDPRFARTSREIWGIHGLEVVQADFTQLTPPAPPGRANFVIANPPYVRHHHLAPSLKQKLKQQVRDTLGIEVSGLAGLYVFFLLLSHQWLTENGVAAWLIPSEWMDVNYGKALRQYLTRHVTLVEIHLFNAQDNQFGDALVSSSIVFLRRRKPREKGKVEITVGGSLTQPDSKQSINLDALEPEKKWSALLRGNAPRLAHDNLLVGDLFVVRRGIATGNNKFFIRPITEWNDLGIPLDCLLPILPPSRLLTSRAIGAREDGYPDMDNPLGVLNSRLLPRQIEVKYPRLMDYLDSAEGKQVRESYLARHRAFWYAQEERSPAPFLCTYMGRGRGGRSPFRFFYNESKAIATNVFLMLYPRNSLGSMIQDRAAGTDIARQLEELTSEHYKKYGRVYGGGLYKLEPRELASLPADSLGEVLGSGVKESQTELALA